jgi:UDP-N-acetylglucosamine 2-epimerase (non-hydrolysing)
MAVALWWRTALARLKVLTVFGTRPEAIKLAPVVLELQRRPDSFTTRTCVTAQHREMLDQVLTAFGLKPDHDLNIMKPGQTLAEVTAHAVQGLSRVIECERPDIVLVQGDTTTAMCGALAAYYNRIAVGHVEAGLRTDDKYAPFPEEMNRRLVGCLADYHFAPTAGARQALVAEGINESAIHLTGNTVIDALLTVRDRVRETRPALPDGLLEKLERKRMVLVTGHRRESFGADFENICHAIRDVTDLVDDVVFVYPVHPNPNVRTPVTRLLGSHERIALVDPLPYEPFVWLMDRALIVLTDSGGVQEEAPSLGKPVLVMREITERPEGIAAGNARLVGVRRQTIVQALCELLEQPAARARMTAVNNPYGDGRAAQRVVDVLERIAGRHAADGQRREVHIGGN